MSARRAARPEWGRADWAISAEGAAGAKAFARALSRTGWISMGGRSPSHVGSSATPGPGATSDGTTITRGTGSAIWNRLSTRRLPSAHRMPGCREFKSPAVPCRACTPAHRSASASRVALAASQCGAKASSRERRISSAICRATCVPLSVTARRAPAGSSEPVRPVRGRPSHNASSSPRTRPGGVHRIRSSSFSTAGEVPDGCGLRKSGTYPPCPEPVRTAVAAGPGAARAVHVRPTDRHPGPVAGPRAAASRRPRATARPRSGSGRARQRPRRARS